MFKARLGKQRRRSRPTQELARRSPQENARLKKSGLLALGNRCGFWRTSTTSGGETFVNLALRERATDGPTESRADSWYSTETQQSNG
jgi:hypothetical protein